MKTVSQRNKLRTFAKPDEFKLQSSQPHGAVECGGQVVRANTQDPAKVRSLRPLVRKAEIPKPYMTNVRLT